MTPDSSQLSSIEHWLSEVRVCFQDEAPELLPLFDIYAAEAVFGRRYISFDLDQLARGAKILEIGAGSLLLSCQLVREGFQVTSLEPTGSGFSHFERMRQMVQEKATALDCLPLVINQTGESLAQQDCYDYAFSVNVMEHVDNVEQVAMNVGHSLTPGASYRFTCPNYSFPYEPHFNIPTLFSKRLTEKVFRRQIFGCKKLPDPPGTWKSLNWISVGQVKRIVKQLPWLHVTFNRQLLVFTLERIAFDESFSERRSPAVRKVILVLVALRLHKLLQFIPAMLQPIMDCKLQKVSNLEVY